VGINQYCRDLTVKFPFLSQLAVSAAPAPKAAAPKKAPSTAYTLNIDLLDLTIASESCIKVPASGKASFEQYIAGLDCKLAADAGTTKTYTCELTGNTTGDLGAILGGVSSACGDANGTPNGGTLLRK